MNPSYQFTAPTAAIMRSPRSSLDSHGLHGSPLQASPVLRAADVSASAGASAVPSLPTTGSVPPMQGVGGEPVEQRWMQPGAEEDWAMRQLSSRMDQIAREMKQSVEHEFVLAERAIMAQKRSSLEAQKLKAEATAYQQQSIIDGLREEKQQLSSKLCAKQKQ